MLVTPLKKYFFKILYIYIDIVNIIKYIFRFRLYSTITSRVLINENLKKHRLVANLIKNVAWYMIKYINLPFVLVSILVDSYSLLLLIIF